MSRRPGLNDYERFFFDLNGYLVIENALTPEEVASCNEAIEQQRERIRIRPPEESLARGAAALEGAQGRGDVGGMLTWPKPWSQPFRDLLTHPAIVPYLNELLGPGFRLDHLYGIMMTKGAEGFVLHGGGNTGDLTHSYQYHNGLMRCGLTVVTWVLSDHGPGDGGFACIPGSHKSNYEPPMDVKRLETDIGVVRQVEARAGSAIIFTEALCHGTLPLASRPRAAHRALQVFAGLDLLRKAVHPGRCGRLPRRVHRGPASRAPASLSPGPAPDSREVRTDPHVGYRLS